MYRMAALAIMALTMGTSAGLTLAAETDDTKQPFKGELVSVVGAYTADVGSQDFFPCHRREQWSVSDESGLAREYASLVTDAGQPFFVEASGYVSPETGGRGRNITITDYTVALMPPRDCFQYD